MELYYNTATFDTLKLDFIDILNLMYDEIAA